MKRRRTPAQIWKAQGTSARMYALGLLRTGIEIRQAWIALPGVQAVSRKCYREEMRAFKAALRLLQTTK